MFHREFIESAGKLVTSESSLAESAKLVHFFIQRCSNGGKGIRLRLGWPRRGANRRNWRRKMGLESRVSKQFKPRTTTADPARQANANLLNQEFDAAGPNEMWVADIAYLATSAGCVTSRLSWTIQTIGFLAGQSVKAGRRN
jgi:hypothetical protein